MYTTTRTCSTAAVALLAIAVLTGCAQPAPAVTDDPVVSAPQTDAPDTPDPRPTALAAESVCFGDYPLPIGAEKYGGPVDWPSPLSDDIGVDPSCWANVLETESNLFLATWYGLSDEQYDAVNTPLEAALQGDGFQLGQDSDGISSYTKTTGELEQLNFTITRTGSAYEVVATYGRG